MPAFWVQMWLTGDHLVVEILTSALLLGLSVFWLCRLSFSTLILTPRLQSWYLVTSKRHNYILWRALYALTWNLRAVCLSAASVD